MLIMLVENRIEELRTLQKYVAECYPESDILPFSSSAAAVEFVKSEKFFVDICFAEIIMPKITGFGLAQELRRHNKNVKIVFMADTSEYAVDAWEHYGNDYLITPVTEDGVRHTLRSCF